MELLRRFDNLTKDDVGLAGGKGASLGEMTHVGLPVPPGFVVLAAAFERFLATTGLNVEIDAILRTADPARLHTIEAASARIQALILGAALPEDLAAAITAEFRALGAEYVAVRSSATAEDSAAAAWAGQLDSYLNTTEASLLANVRRCWASLFTPRAVFYRFEKGLRGTRIAVAVVVQKMVESESSGVAFSVHPVTQDRNQAIIEAGYGLGEAIVSGAITPDSYVVEKEPLRLVGKTVSTQTRGIYRCQGGGCEWIELPPRKGDQQVLSDAEILELATLVTRIERHYGFPCDIEWAREGGRFYIVQSRPITTLGPAAAPRQIVFKKSISRDTTLFMQRLWARGLDEQARTRFGWVNPSLPIVAHFVNHGVVEIWEHEAGIQWFLDRLLAANQDPAFLTTLFAEYRGRLQELKALQAKGVLTDERDRQAYADLAYRAAFDMTLFFYTGMDERSPAAAKEMAVEARKAGDFFADNDAFSRQLIARLGGLTLEQAGVVLPDELAAIPPADVLTRRLEAFLVVDGLVPHLGSLESFQAAHAGIVFRQEAAAAGLREITGQSAYRGLARGLVRLVRKQSDLVKVAAGDILVSPMTTPDFMPAMNLAAAFVTDEGGVTCHAAIVARELKKPCIIGTKVATQALKDGDLVEVDADTGIVRIIR